jgi:hypothetical protein
MDKKKNIETLNATSFHKLMIDIDKELAEKEIPAFDRMLVAYGKIRGHGSYEINQEIDPTCGPYEGSNLLFAIEDWYTNCYPSESIHAKPFGKRPILIRSEPFMMKLPMIFNADPKTISAIKYIEGITESLLQILDETERLNLQSRFNIYFMQASNLALLRVQIQYDLKSPNEKLIQELILSGCGDLNSASRSVIRDEPGAYMWCIQQSVEKFFKAYLAFVNSAMTKENLKQKFGHNLEKIVREARASCDAFEKILPYIEKVNVSPDMRYKPSILTYSQAVEIIDLAYSICDFIVCVLLEQVNKTR